MSFDELPPDSTPPRRKRNVKASPEQEATPSDAPPAAPKRRRRAQADGTDAASAPASPAPETPVRTPRTRRKALPAEDPSASESATSQIQEPTLPEGTSPEEAPSAKSPRRRRAVKPVSAGESTVSETVPQPAETAPIADVVVPSKRRRRPSQEEATPAAETADATAPATETPVRRRSPRRQPAPSTEIAKPEPAPTAEGATTEADDAITPVESEDVIERHVTFIPVDAESPHAEASDAPAETSVQEAASSAVLPVPARPRRGKLSRRPKTEVPKATAILPPAPETVTPTEDAEDQEETEEGENPQAPVSDAPAGRSRRRRGRSRRSEPRNVRTPEATTIEVAQAAPVVVAAESVVEKIDLSIGAHLVPRIGGSEIQINGTIYPPILFFGNLEDSNRNKVLSEVRRAARAGVHLHSTLVELPCPLTEATHALDTIDDRLRAILEADPEGYVMPRVVFVPARGWKREYPTEIAAYADGTAGDPSITSERFWQEAERSLSMLVSHLREYAWGKRIFGFHLEHGEWFQPADQGYDRSIANRDAFRDWLRDKYKHNLIALRAAWYDGDVQFHTADIPNATKPNPQRAFFETRRERNIIDFNEFTSETTARRIIMLARAVKKAAKSQVLVSVCYGYTFEFGHPSSGHLALETLESSREIDLICGPPSYRDRKPGGAASFPAPVNSPALHRKLWLSEDDTKTFLAPSQQPADDFNPRLGDRFSTEQAQARAQGRSLAQSTAVGWMDLWGEGWLDDDGLWNHLSAFTTTYRAFLQQRSTPEIPDVIALIDEKSLLHLQRGEAFFRKLTNGLRETLQRVGVSFGTYLQSDILADNFPTSARMYLFLTPFRLTPELRTAIKEKLQRGGKTLVWLYAPGACEERPSLGGGMEEAATGAVGFTLRQQAWNSEVGSRVSDPYHTVTERMANRDFGTRERLNPSYFVDDPDATVLAEYIGSGLPSMAVRDFGTWKTVFVGEPGLPLELLRGICRYAGVPVWTPQGEDVVTIGNGWVTIHAARDGQRTLYLPEVTGIYDVSESRLIADEAKEYRFFLRSGMTRTFCIGPTERFFRLGLPNVTLPGSDRAKIVLQAPSGSSSPRREPNTLPAPLRADLETLEAVLTVDVSMLSSTDLDEAELLDEDLELEESASDESESEASDPGAPTAPRRRRRRGGRGRGRRRPSGKGEATDDANPPVGLTSEEGVFPLPETQPVTENVGIALAPEVEFSPYDPEREEAPATYAPETESETLLPAETDGEFLSIPEPPVDSPQDATEPEPTLLSDSQQTFMETLVGPDSNITATEASDLPSEAEPERLPTVTQAETEGLPSGNNADNDEPAVADDAETEGLPSIANAVSEEPSDTEEDVVVNPVEAITPAEEVVVEAETVEDDRPSASLITIEAASPSAEIQSAPDLPSEPVAVEEYSAPSDSLDTQEAPPPVGEGISESDNLPSAEDTVAEPLPLPKTENQESLSPSEVLLELPSDVAEIPEELPVIPTDISEVPLPTAEEIPAALTGFQESPAEAVSESSEEGAEAALSPETAEPVPDGTAEAEMAQTTPDGADEPMPAEEGGSDAEISTGHESDGSL